MLWKLAYTVFVLLVVAIWRRHYGWRNLLWFSDVALIGAVPALWLESAALTSVLAVTVLLPEILWNVDFVLRLLLRRRVTGLTDYMFEPERPRLLRVLSALFHVPLPVLLVWMLSEYGYDASVGLPGAVLLAGVVLPLSRAVSTPAVVRRLRPGGLPPDALPAARPVAGRSVSGGRPLRTTPLRAGGNHRV
jgi:hypothetical protein